VRTTKCAGTPLWHGDGARKRRRYSPFNQRVLVCVLEFLCGVMFGSTPKPWRCHLCRRWWEVHQRLNPHCSLHLREMAQFHQRRAGRMSGEQQKQQQQRLECEGEKPHHQGEGVSERSAQQHTSHGGGATLLPPPAVVRPRPAIASVSDSESSDSEKSYPEVVDRDFVGEDDRFPCRFPSTEAGNRIPVNRIPGRHPSTRIPGRFPAAGRFVGEVGEDDCFPGLFPATGQFPASVEGNRSSVPQTPASSSSWFLSSSWLSALGLGSRRRSRAATSLDSSSR